MRMKNKREILVMNRGFLIEAYIYNRQKEAWHIPQTVYILNQYQQPSPYSHFR